MKKTNKYYLFFRFFCATVFLAWVSLIVSVNMLPRGSNIVLILFLISIPLFPLALFISFSLAAYTFPFSIFGSLQRTPFPTSKPLYKSKGMWVRIGLLGNQGRAIEWYVFEEGLGFRGRSLTRFIGEGFIPLPLIKGVQKRRFLGSREILHNSTEVRRPVIVPSVIGEQVQKILFNGKDDNS